MAALVLIGLNVFDAWLMRIFLGLEGVELNPLAPPVIANLVARGLIAVATILILNLARKDNLLWWANLVILGLVCWHVAFHTIPPLMNHIS